PVLRPHVSCRVFILLLSVSLVSYLVVLPFFFNATATTEIYTLSLHDALPIFLIGPRPLVGEREFDVASLVRDAPLALLNDVNEGDRKSTRLNSSHEWISYAVFCLKKKKKKKNKNRHPTHKIDTTKAQKEQQQE